MTRSHFVSKFSDDTLQSEGYYSTAAVCNASAGRFMLVFPFVTCLYCTSEFTHTKGLRFPLHRSLLKLRLAKVKENKGVKCLWNRKKDQPTLCGHEVKSIRRKNRHKQIHTCNTLDAISLSPWFSTDILQALTSTVCFCLILQAKQCLIHLNKRVVQPAVAALRTGSEEWDCISKRATETESAGCGAKEEVYISGKSFCEQRHSKINSACVWCLLLGPVRKILFKKNETF